MKSFRRVGTVALILTLGLSACSSVEQMTIAIPEPEVLEEGQDHVFDRVRHALGTNGEREVEDQEVSAADRVEALRSGQAAVTLGCVGELLEELDAHRADQLRVQLDAEDEDARRDGAHAAMAASLPPELAVTNPGIEEKCEGEDLPQHLVVLYRQEVLNRDDVAALNAMVGSTE